MYLSQGCAGCFGYQFPVLAIGQGKAPESRRESVRRGIRFPAKESSRSRTESYYGRSSGLVVPSQRCLDFRVRTPERPSDIRILDAPPVKAEWQCPGRSGTARHQRSDVDFSLPYAKRSHEADYLATSLSSRKRLAQRIAGEALYRMLRSAILSAPTSAQPEQRHFIFSFSSLKRPPQSDNSTA
jgi:hypothetical protein